MQLELNGLWKDAHCELLVQLHGARVVVLKSWRVVDDAPVLKAVVRVMKGDETMMQTHVQLISVMPKREVKIQVVDAWQRGPTMWDFTGVVTGVAQTVQA